MGTYCELYVDEYPVLPNKSAPDPVVMTIFREGDKVVAERRVSARNPVAWSHIEAIDDEAERVVEYKATVGDVKSRLRAMGFTLPFVQADFDTRKDQYLAELKSRMEDHPDLYREEVVLLDKSSFDQFLSAFREILATRTHPVYVVKRVPSISQLAKYILDDDEAEFYWHFPCSDIRCFLRALLEAVPDSSSVMQELTDLVEGQYFDADANMIDWSLQMLKGDYSINSPVVVLTEGSTDSECIRVALEVLYPELTGYYSFMDLAVRAPGGTGSLVHIVKAFAGAGIENRMVALFDNDTAGHAALSLLKHVRLPQTIRAVAYPDTERARSYPAIGPTGIVNQDINGAACSIELYFGGDVLMTSGSLLPVQWRGYDDRLKRFQGEIGQKDNLKREFLRKSEAAKQNRNLIESQDWGDMRKLVDVLIDAFNSDEQARAAEAAAQARKPYLMF
jgi:hypothetical protein